MICQLDDYIEKEEKKLDRYMIFNLVGIGLLLGFIFGVFFCKYDVDIKIEERTEFGGRLGS